MKITKEQCEERLYEIHLAGTVDRHIMIEELLEDVKPTMGKRDIQSAIKELDRSARQIQREQQQQPALPIPGNFFVDALSWVEGIDASCLPNCKWTRPSENAPPGPRSSQDASPSNMTYLLQLVGATKWFNCMTQNVEWSFGDRMTGFLNSCGADIQSVAVPLLKEMASRCDIAPEASERALEDINAMNYHPMAQWLQSLPAWDGVDRLQAIADGLPTRNPQSYVRAVIRRWFVQGVQAVHNWQDPQQIPHVLCFSGKQGAGKTRFFVTCAPGCFTMEGATLSLSGDTVRDRDSIRNASRTAIVELGELETVFSKSSNEALKNYLSSRTITYRMAYGKREITVPRCTIYGGTVNSTAFLRDETGSRRFWPITIAGPIQPIDGADHVQLWAQALHLWRNGEPWFLTPDEEKQHAEIVGYHREITSVEEVLPEVFPHGFWTRPHGTYVSEDDPEYELLNIGEIAKRCDIENPTAAERRLIRHYVEENGGRSGRYAPHPNASGYGEKKTRNHVFMALLCPPEDIQSS